MLDGNTERPDVTERYEAACSASTLKVSAECVGPGDVLIASAWSDRGFGGALVRLHSAWLKIKPRYVTQQDVERYADQLPQKRGRQDVGRARRELIDAYMLAVKETAEGMPGRKPIINSLTEWAEEKGIDAEHVGACLTFWLASQCPFCHGLGQHKMKDAPALGAKCTHCAGSGKRAAPLDAGRILDRITHSISVWRSATQARLRGR